MTPAERNLLLAIAAVLDVQTDMWKLTSLGEQNNVIKRAVEELYLEDQARSKGGVDGQQVNPNLP